MTDEVPEALKLAREARVSDKPFTVATPSKLWRVGADDDADLYRHAMIEAGYLVETATDEPFDPCPICGWSPNE